MILSGSQGPKGETGNKGDSTIEIFLKTAQGAAQPATPSATSYTNGAFVNLSAGWTTDLDSLTSSNYTRTANDLWRTFTTVDTNNNTLEAFKKPWRADADDGAQGIQGPAGSDGVDGLAGTNGTDGDDGNTIVWLFRRASGTTTTLTTPRATSYNPASGTLSGVSPSGWNVNYQAAIGNTPIGTDAIWVSKALYNAAANLPNLGAFEEPTRLTGVSGHSGG